MDLFPYQRSAPGSDPYLAPELFAERVFNNLRCQMQNPFQSANLRNLTWWQGVKLYDEKNLIFDKLTQELHESFSRAVDTGTLRPFCKDYRRISKEMMQELPTEPLLSSIIDHALRRLVIMYCYLRQRKNSSLKFLDGDSSVVRWKLDPALLTKAMDQANRMQQSCVPQQTFDLKSSPGLLRWIFENYWPLVRQFSGRAAAPIPCGYIRCMSSDKQGAEYKERFRYHRYGNHHYDESAYSLPLIIYLSDVSPSSGPFEYLSDSGKYSTNFVLRAFHQALNHDCKISSLDETSFSVIARLPGVFRGGDVFGNFYRQVDFEKAGPTVVTGGIGTATMFHGYSVIHAGGFPSEGCRKSLFVHVRFPVAQIITKIRSLFLN